MSDEESSSEPVSPKVGKSALAFICITILIDTAGFGVIIPVFPKLLMELTGEGLGTAALYAGSLLTIYAVTQFFAAPVLGNLSDRFGRRPILVFSMLAFSVDYIFMGFAPTVAFLFIGRFFAGILGATFATANAFIADISSEENRARNFGYIGAAWGLGFIVGPMLGGLLGQYGPRLPFFVAAGIAFANAVFGFFVLPESLPKENRRAFSFKRANPLGALIQIKKFPMLIGFFVIILLNQLAHDVNPAVWSYYVIEKFNWSEAQIGYSLGWVGFMVIVVYGGLVGPVVKKIGERNAIYFGMIMLCIGYCGFGLSTEGWMLYAFTIPFALGGLENTSIRSIMAGSVPANMQGELQGAVSSVLSLTMIFSPMLMTGLFHHFTRDRELYPDATYFPGVSFVTAAAITVLSLLVYIIWCRRVAPAAAE